MRCRDIMKTQVHTCRENDSIRNCARVMREQNIGFVPVIGNNGQVTGVITDRDMVVRGLAEGLGIDEPVQSCMSTDLVYCSPNDDLMRAEDLLRRNKKSRVLVLDDQGRCEGVISLSDIGEHEEPSRAGEVFRDVVQREVHAK